MVCTYLDSQAFGGVVDLTVHNTLGQAELGDAIDKHATEAVQRFEDHNSMTLARDVDGARQASRPRPHDGYLLAGGLSAVERTRAARKLVVADVPLKAANRHRLALLREDARLLALDFLGADPTAYGGEAILDLHSLDGPQHVALAQCGQELRDQDADRATLDAVRAGALETAIRLLPSQVFGEAKGYLVEVDRADERILLRHRLTRQVKSLALGQGGHHAGSAVARSRRQMWSQRVAAARSSAW